MDRRLILECLDRLAFELLRSVRAECAFNQVLGLAGLVEIVGGDVAVAHTVTNHVDDIFGPEAAACAGATRPVVRAVVATAATLTRRAREKLRMREFSMFKVLGTLKRDRNRKRQVPKVRVESTAHKSRQAE